MKATYIERLGGAEEIRYGELPDPVPGPGQVVVRVQAVAVNSVDTLLRSGRWRTDVSFPLAVGRDLVGTVASIGRHVGTAAPAGPDTGTAAPVGPDTSDLTPGERVWTNSAGYGGRPGATAELVAVERERLYRLPPSAEADPLAFVASVHPGATAHGALRGRARLQAGERLAVVGANGAVGMCAVQLGAAAGAEVIAVIRNPAATAHLNELGARHVVIADPAEAPRAASAAAGAALDVVIDATGRLDIGSAPEHLAPRGRILLVAGAGTAELDLRSFYLNEAQLLGFIMSGMTVAELAAAAEWINARPPEVSVGRVLGFDAAAEAHAILEGGRLPHLPDGTVGRLVLTPAAED